MEAALGFWIKINVMVVSFFTKMGLNLGSILWNLVYILSANVFVVQSSQRSLGLLPYEVIGFMSAEVSLVTWALGCDTDCSVKIYALCSDSICCTAKSSWTNFFEPVFGLIVHFQVSVILFEFESLLEIFSSFKWQSSFFFNMFIF